jgi:SET domain-containing protein
MKIASQAQIITNGERSTINMIELFIAKSKIHGKGVFTVINVKEGEFFGSFEGHEVPQHSKHSLTLNGSIIEPTGTLKFLNHSCAPNAYFIGANLVANRKIKANEEITISYIVTEGEIKYPCQCTCGSDKCKNWVRAKSGV